MADGSIQTVEEEKIIPPEPRKVKVQEIEKETEKEKGWLERLGDKVEDVFGNVAEKINFNQREEERIPDFEVHVETDPDKEQVRVTVVEAHSGHYKGNEEYENHAISHGIHTDSHENPHEHHEKHPEVSGHHENHGKHQKEHSGSSHEKVEKRDEGNEW
jgi:hypothetical protein